MLKVSLNLGQPFDLSWPGNDLKLTSISLARQVLLKLSDKTGGEMDESFLSMFEE